MAEKEAKSSSERANKKYVELLWAEKYQEYEKGEKKPIEKPNLPFQVVETVNKPRLKDLEEGLFDPSKFYPESEYPEKYPKDWKNLLIWGDNKLVMSSLIKQGWAGKINLIYIDPPFFTGADFGMKFKIDEEGNFEVANYWETKNTIVKEPSIIEERAYKDTWGHGIASYIRMMYERLILLRELLSEDGHIFVHCDWHVGHYVKVVMDEIFGYDCFKSEVIWQRAKTVGRVAKPYKFDMLTDSVLFYSKNPTSKINKQKIKRYYSINEAKRLFKFDDKVKKYFKHAPPGNYSEETLKALDGEGRIYWTSSGNPRVKTFVESAVIEGQRFVVEQIEIGNIWTDLPDMMHVSKEEKTGFPNQKPEELLARIILASSNPGDIVADFFCGSGTTLAVTEKLGRRWIGCDLSKFAIQVTRKRLLDIHNSKDLMAEKGKKNYDKVARPFELWNIGNYETVYWQEREDEYLAFMLRLYQAQTLTGFKYLHGRKGDRTVHVGPLNAPVTMEEVEKVIIECRANNFNKGDVLGWEWSYEVNELARELAKNNGVDLKLVQIPSVNEIKSSLVGFDLQLFKVPDEAIEKELLQHIKFAEVAYLEIETKVNKKEVALKITDFQVSPTVELAEISSKVKDSRELIDYWAIDWDYKGDTFHNQWQSFRVKKNPRVDYETSYPYKEPGEYQIMVKVVDVFGNDTNKVLKVRVK